MGYLIDPQLEIFDEKNDVLGEIIYGGELRSEEKAFEVCKLIIERIALNLKMKEYSEIETTIKFRSDVVESIDTDFHIKINLTNIEYDFLSRMSSVDVVLTHSVDAQTQKGKVKRGIFNIKNRERV